MWDSSALIFKALLELRVVEDLSIRHTSISTDVHPQELVVFIHKGHTNHREEALVIVVRGLFTCLHEQKV